jgi:hypothetical protein
MNDYEEVSFGILHGVRLLKESADISNALRTDARRVAFSRALDRIVAYYGQNLLLDTYVFCLTEHAPNNRDGLLSMWRGYGGNGKGAAIVFDTSKLEPVHDSPLILARVHYGSQADRFKWLGDKAKMAARLLTTVPVPDDKLHIAAGAMFERIKLFALFTKHDGFREENEWRDVYMRERDTGNKLVSKLGYFNGPRTVEPKLKLKIAPIDRITGPDLSLEKTVSAILLGPTTSSELARQSVARMLDVIKKPYLKDRLIASTIPFRSTD